MYYKLKNTLAGLAVAMSILGMSYSIGHAPSDSATRLSAVLAQPAEAGTRIDFTTPGLQVEIDQLQNLRKRNRGMRTQLSMPFFSFAPLLPRRES